MASNPENINFLDLACLLKIEKDTTLERFGSVINASIFDAANITGSLKQKGLIDFTAYYPGPNSIVVTDAGNKLKEDAETKSGESIDALDLEVLRQMSGGKRYPAELQSTLNVRSRDLAFRLYKLYKQNFVGYELKNGNVELTLTEQGFLQAKPMQTVRAPAPKQAQTMQQEPQTMQPQAEAAPIQPEAPTVPMDSKIPPLKLHGKPRRKLWIGVAAAIVIVAVVYYLYAYMPGVFSSI